METGKYLHLSTIKMSGISRLFRMSHNPTDWVILSLASSSFPCHYGDATTLTLPHHSLCVSSCLLASTALWPLLIAVPTVFGFRIYECL